MRHSGDELATDGTVKNGFDYELQVWVKDGLVLPCGHPHSMQPGCCNAFRYAMMPVAMITGHQVR